MEKDSRIKLLKAATKEFAKNGFAGTSTRAIAGRANINISAIAYYFGGKKGLYANVLEYVGIKLVEGFEDLIKRYENMHQEEKAKDLLKEFFARFLNLFADDCLEKGIKELFFAEYFKPSEHFEVLYKEAILPFYKMLGNLLIIESKSKIKKQDAYLFIFPLLAQMIVFAARKDNICKLMNWPAFGQKEKEKILKSVYKQIDGITYAQ